MDVRTCSKPKRACRLRADGNGSMVQRFLNRLNHRGTCAVAEGAEQLSLLSGVARGAIEGDQRSVDGVCLGRVLRPVGA